MVMCATRNVEGGILRCFRCCFPSWGTVESSLSPRLGEGYGEKTLSWFFVNSTDGDVGVIFVGRGLRSENPVLVLCDLDGQRCRCHLRGESGSILLSHPQLL